jgi:hypothetical protein
MPIINFYFPDELYLKIQKLDQKSQIAQELFEEYFLKSIKPDLKEISQKLEKSKSDFENLNKLKTKIEVENHVKEITNKEKLEKLETKTKEKIENIRKNAVSFFEDFAKLKEIDQNKFIDDFQNDNPDDLNIIQFLNSKGFKDNIVIEEKKEKQIVEEKENLES